MPATRPPIAASPTSSSSAWRSPRSATACRSSPSRCTAPSTPSRQSVRAVTMIPGAGEFIYSDTAVSRKVGAATNIPENVHTLQGGTDWSVSLDQLQATLPNVGSVSLIAGWFGTDLRAGECQIRPGVDADDKVTAPLTWSVAGLSRGAAHLISLHERPLRLRRHAVRRQHRLRHPGPARARPRRHADAVPVHGRSGRQRAARSLRRRRAVGLSLARPYHRSRPPPASPALPTRRPDAATQIEAFVGTAAPVRLRHRRRERSSIPAPPSGATAASSCTTRTWRSPPAGSMPS